MTKVETECSLECKNGGKCVFGKKNACDCTGTMFTGELCEEPKADFYCNSTSFCFNDGTCDKNKCICAPGYTGERCQIKNKNKCGDNLTICQNDATCVISNENIHECQCKPYFTGKQCETSLNLCKTHKPCKNIDQICIWNPIDLTSKCENIVTSTIDSSINNQILIASTLGITLPILLILIIILILRIYKNQQTMTTINDEIININNNDNNKQLSPIKSSTVFKIINNNLFDDNKNNKEKIVCVNNIKESLLLTSTPPINNIYVSYDNLMASIV
jgi:hypothetical protein